MAKNRKEWLYWASLILYGVLLTGLLLYIRFPTEKFRDFCERFIEEKIPSTSCTIAEISYSFPFTLNFYDVELRLQEGEVVYSDSKFSLTPSWKNPKERFSISSSAFNGNHSLVLEVDNEAEQLNFRDIFIKDGDLSQVPIIEKKFGRRMKGLLSMTGELLLKKKNYSLVGGEGDVEVKNGEFGLNKEILQMSMIELTESSVHFKIEKRSCVLSKGEVKNNMINTSFSGSIGLADPYLSGALNIQGTLTPTPQLYKENRQLKNMVKRMQRKYKKDALPYKTRGSLGRPSFVFGK